MRIPEELVDETKFQMAPMIDMVFLLLVFFMCASTLSQRSMNVPLDIPTASKGVIPEDRPNRWVVNVTQDGTIHSGMDEISLEALKAEVAARVQRDPDLRIYLRADAETEHREIKRVMNAMAESGVDDFIFGVYMPLGSES